MTKEQFQKERKARMERRYKELKAQKSPKLNRDQRLGIISIEEGDSPSTIRQILFNSNYLAK